MYYEFNISLHGKHLFATNQRSVTTYEEATNLFEILETKFPISEGYQISCSKVETCGIMLPEFHSYITVS